jgi:hypothetical protein
MMSGFSGSPEAVVPQDVLVTAMVLKYEECPSQKLMIAPSLCRVAMLR